MNRAPAQVAPLFIAALQWARRPGITSLRNSICRPSGESWTGRSQPHNFTSIRLLDRLLPRACPGDIYLTVPKTAPASLKLH